jgi:hypothetical protein
MSGSSGSQLTELLAGSSSAFITITLDKNIGDGGQVQWDGKYVTLQDEVFPGSIYRIKVSGSAGTIVGATKFHRYLQQTNPSWIYNGYVAFPFTSQTSESPNIIGVWKYPRGGKEIAEIKGFGGGVTVSVPPRQASKR